MHTTNRWVLLKSRFWLKQSWRKHGIAKATIKVVVHSFFMALYKLDWSDINLLGESSSKLLKRIAIFRLFQWCKFLAVTHKLNGWWTCKPHMFLVTCQSKLQGTFGKFPCLLAFHLRRKLRAPEGRVEPAFPWKKMTELKRAGMKKQWFFSISQNEWKSWKTGLPNVPIIPIFFR